MRVGIDVSFSAVTSASTTVDVTIDFYTENSYTFSDSQTITTDSGSGTLVNTNYTNSQGSGVATLRKTNTRSNLPISYSGGPSYTATAEVTGAFDGSNPSKSRTYTLPARPSSIPGAPGGPYIQNVTNNSAQVYVTGAAANGSTVDAYQIEIATNTGFTTGYQLANNSNNVFGGLAAATTYYTRSRAHNANGWGPYTTTKSFTTGATVPGTPTGVGNNTVTQSTANITWTAPASDGGSAITGYQIQTATDTGFTQNVSTVDDPDDVSPYQLTGLNPATTYYARVRALNGVGAGAWSSGTGFTTLTGTPTIVSPTSGQSVSKGFPSVTMSATGIQASSTITVEVAKRLAAASEVLVMTATAATNLMSRTDGVAHGLVAGDTVTFTDVTNAAPLAINTTYYVIASGLTTTAFKLSATLNGTEIDITGNASGSKMVEPKPGFEPWGMTAAAGTDLMTRTDGVAHGLVAGDVVYFTNVTNAAPLVVGTPYYVISSGLTTTAFKLATTVEGSAIDITGTGAGSILVRYHTLTSTPGSASANNQYTLEDTAKLMNNGTWSTRSRVTTTSISYTTPNSTAVNFTVSHTPAAILNTPATGTTAKYTASTNFVFTFSDANTADKMRAYQLVIEYNNDGSSVFDSGKTLQAGTSNSQQFTIPVALSTAVKGQVLRWKARVYDRNDQVSTYTGYSTLTLVDPPLVTITSPGNGSTVTTGSPTFTWTFSAPSGGTQSTAFVEVKDSTTNAVVWSTTVTGTAVTVTPPITILQNGKSYTVSVTSTDTYGLATTASNSFTASYSAPSALFYVYDADDADLYGYVDVDWTGATADSLFTRWKVYRRAASDSTGTWVLVYESTDQNVRHYFDYLLVPGDSYSYSVTQVAYRSGSLLESPVGYYYDTLANLLQEDRSVTPVIEHYWIVDPTTNQNSVRLETVTGDDSTLEFESASYNIIGRGRHRDYGDELGYTGTLTCQVRGTERSSTFRRKVETLRRNQETYYLRTPFGKLFPVALGDIGWSPLPGTGLYEMGTLTIPYEEVAE